MRILVIFLLTFLVGLSRTWAATELNVHHFLSTESTTHKLMIAPWAQEIENATEGALKFHVYPSMSLGGKAPELYAQVRDGVVDIAWTLIGYTPGLFPRTEVFELPGVHQGSALQTTLAMNRIFDRIEADFEDVHVLLLHAHSGNALHMVRKKIEDFRDLRHLRLRTPSRTGGWMIASWNAIPVSMPVPRLPLALAKGNVDGALLPFEVIPALRVQDLTAHSVEGPSGYRFGTSVFVLLMNKDRYQKLEPTLRQALDAASGVAFQRKIGELWEAQELLGKQAQLASGSSIVTLSDEQLASIRKNDSAVWKRWIKAVAKQGIDGRRLLNEARAAMQRAP